MWPPDAEADRVRALPPPRAIVEVVSPVVDGGRYPAKGTVDEPVVVLADVFIDGHDHPTGSVWVASPDAPSSWVEHPMEFLGNDRWRAMFVPDRLGLWRYQVAGWHARFTTWRTSTQLKVAAGQDVRVDLLAGAELLDEVLRTSTLSDDERQLAKAALADLGDGAHGDWLQDVELAALMNAKLDRRPLATSDTYTVRVDPERARFSSWYEFFPRPGTLRDAVDRLDRSPTSASTSSTSRRSTRSARRSARAEQHPRRRGRRRSAARGRSARRRAATPRSHPSSARVADVSQARRGVRASAACTSPSTSRSSARPTIRG